MVDKRDHGNNDYHHDDLGNRKHVEIIIKLRWIMEIMIIIMIIRVWMKELY